MNTELWIGMILLVAIAFAIIIPPLWRKKALQHSDVAEQNIAIAKQKLQELKNQLKAQNITRQQYDQQLLELETALDDDLSLSQEDDKPVREGRWVIILIASILPVMVFGLYQTYGDPDALNRSRYVQPNQAQHQAQNSNSKLSSVEKMVAGLAEKMQQNPDDAEGWIMLGRSYKYLNQYDKAVQSYEKAYAIKGEDAELLLQYADALVMANAGKFTEKSRDMIGRALVLTPHDTTALWLNGIASAETGELVVAIKHLSKAQRKFTPDEDSYRELSEYISSVKAHMSPEQLLAIQAWEATQPKPAPVVADMADVLVNVSLSAEIKNQVADNDVVFVYAKALSGPQMPLAIVRKQVKDLPFQVHLTDAQAMTPTMKLSNYDQVTVVARISKSGKTTQQPGDFIDTVKSVDVNSKQAVDIVLSSPVGQSKPTAKPKPAVVQPNAVNNSAAGIKVQVSLSPDLQSRVADGDALFVYAKALTGPPMPLAIVRKQVQDLPLLVELSDAQAMSPAMKLSGFDAVQVVARISKSGQAMKQPGDLIGSLKNVAVRGQQTIELTINDVIK